MNKYIESTKPSSFIEIKWEKREDFQYLQPRRYVNGEVDCWGSHRNIENDQWQRARDVIMDESEFWKDENAKEEAFKIVYDYIKTLPGEVTKMFPFEIFLMNNGFKMESFDCLTAIKPGICFIADKIEGDRVFNPRGFNYKRYYLREERLVSMQFGVNQYKFFFNLHPLNETEKDIYGCYHISNEEKDFENAINGNLKRLYEDDAERSPIYPML